MPQGFDALAQACAIDFELLDAHQGLVALGGEVRNLGRLLLDKALPVFEALVGRQQGGRNARVGRGGVINKARGGGGVRGHGGEVAAR